MDIATRFHPRARAQPYLAEDSGGESESNLIRRKFQRTTTDPETSSSTDTPFRKPTLPASATRPAGLEHRPSLSQRRRSTLRENIRVPSGPREFPSSPGKQRIGSMSSTAPAVADFTNTNTRPFLPQVNPNADPFFYNTNSSSRINMAGAGQQNTTRASFGNNTKNFSSSADDTDSPTTPAERTLGEDFDFLPDVNFDDFQTTIKNYDGTSPLIDQFPTVGGGRALPREEDYSGMARSNGFAAAARTAGGGGGGGGGGGEIQQEHEHEQQKKQGLSRTQSLRQRLVGGRQASGALQQQTGTKDAAAAASSSSQLGNTSLRDRRKSSMPPQPSMSGPPPAGVAPKPPRKSVGPGLITSMMKGNSSHEPVAGPQSGSNLKSALARTSSLSKVRRTTMGPSAPVLHAEAPRVSTLTATTQSRQNKVKSLQPPPRDQQEVNTTPSGKSASKGGGGGGGGGGQNRAHTPSSSGNKRQSMAASGRASGLGARTISPTDARRLKRLSIAQAPPMPTNLPPKGTPTPSEEMPNPMNTYRSLPDVPRLTQPSPSLIPRKTSNATPSSARASPEGRQFPGGGGVSVALSTKSSFSSLIDRPANGSTSRLPTPKPRNQAAMQSSSSMAQYGDSYDEREVEEFVPPVPAIPKAYESPKDLDPPPFFSTASLKSSQSGVYDPLLDERWMNMPPPARTLATPRTSFDVPSETPRKRSGEHARQAHKRANTVNSANNAVGAPAPAPAPAPVMGPPRSARTQPDPNGRKNNNLQPLRLPPMNLMPINTRMSQTVTTPNAPRPSQELDMRGDDFMSFATPEPKRMAKTPSTPMTASKATFFRRHDDQNKAALRASSSHYALRDLMGMDSEGNITRFWDDSDVESGGQGVPIGNYSSGRLQQQQQQRSAITPFASGSLPKGSGEFARLRGRPSGEYYGGGFEDEYSLGTYDNLNLQSARPLGGNGGVAARGRTQTVTSVKSTNTATSEIMALESPVVEQQQQPPSYHQLDTSKKEPAEKKEKEPGSAGGGLRRKLSLGWRRSSSKAANHAENKNSPQQSQHDGGSAEKERSRLQKRQSEMPPPKLPASATASATMWSGGDVPSLPSSARPSLEQGLGGFRQNLHQHHHARRKSQIPSSISSTNLALGLSAEGIVGGGGGEQQVTGGVKTRSLHSEQPTPVNSSSSATASAATARATSWGNTLRSMTGGNNKANNNSSRHKFTPSTLSAIVKDKDDVVADEEMQRLSRKRKDVDSAARETDELRKRAVARSPVSAEHVLHDRGLMGGSVLNVFERGEIVDYENDGIFFTGTKAARKIIGSLTPSPQPPSSSSSDDKGKSGAGGGNNFGYDDERGDYNIVLGDHLAYRYEAVDLLGKGSFGQVVRCVDHRDGGVVAVKIIRNKKRFHQQALVEVGILGRLREWDPDAAHATLSITSSFYFRSHLCIVTPCLSINLYELIRAHNFVGFSLPLIRRFARQLLSCLTLLQQKRIIHCDLKPENILLCEARKADVRVIDFGSSCREEEKVYTYIQSRFYRSPEVILGSSYGLGIDMWSLGCILAEMWTGYPIFPGENEQEQLACIMEIFGPPDRHLVERCTRKKLFFDSVGKPRVTVSSKGRRRRPSSKTLQQALKTEDDAFVDFISRCLRWDPDRRMKPTDAVGHPFITNLPLNQRPGIPDEARRAARVRSSAAVPAQSIPSPVKRGSGTAVSSSGNAFAAQANVITPAKDRSRPLPETPQTALRNGVPAAAVNHGSPVKATGGNRRHSTVATAGAAAVAGSKRASNGVVLGGGATTLGTVGGAGQQQPRQGSASLAQMAARESMGVAGATLQNSSLAAAARWRT